MGTKFLKKILSSNEPEGGAEPSQANAELTMEGKYLDYFMKDDDDEVDVSPIKSVLTT